MSPRLLPALLAASLALAGCGKYGPPVRSPAQPSGVEKTGEAQPSGVADTDDAQPDAQERP